MTIRSLTLLTPLLLLVSLSGCGTDTKITGELGGSGFTTNHADSTATANIIEGYVIKQDADGKLICGDCHKTDRSDVTINRQWADSAHAGHILTAGVVQDSVTKNSAWAHYDWDSISRQNCQQCHTSTGQANFMKAQAIAGTYNSKKNDFSHLAGWVGTKDVDGQFVAGTTVSNQNELLYCWGCHSSVETAALLAPSNVGIKPGYNVNGASLEMPNLGASNACVGCHSGRGNVQSLLTTAPTGGIDPTVVLTTSTIPKSTATATSTHYKNAAATIFHAEAKVGYEFPGLDYADPDKYGDPPISYLHRFSNCVACHMSGEESHSFSTTQKDTVTGEITAINSQKTCNGCHSSLIPMNAEKLEESRKGYEESLHVLEHEFALHGYVFVNAFPYFYVGTTSGVELFYRSPSTVVPTVYSAIATDRNGDSVINALDWIDANADNVIDSADLVKQPVTWAKQGDLGAGHNFNYLHHEPGAYAHNRFYAQRLIFDSIDWLDNATMDGQITIGSDYPAARIWFNADSSGLASRP
jgi:mono/diheme cytochrome c family protein